jgi:hypothetical protein
MIKRKPTLDTSEQHKRFIETARQLECDENKERFEEKMPPPVKWLKAGN